MEIQFYEEARNTDLKFAVIAAQYEGDWLLCRHKDRETWEFPGGHREDGESILTAARRELWEETGATGYQLEPVSAYVVSDESKNTWGALFFADIWELGPRPDSEIAEQQQFKTLPGSLTYPEITSALLAYSEDWLAKGNFRSELEDLLELRF